MTVKMIKAATVRRRRALFLAGTVLFSGITFPAFAQSTPGIDPIRVAPDENGVDLLTGQVDLPGASVSIGDPGKGGMVYAETWRWGGPTANVGLVAFIDPSGAIGGLILENGVEKVFKGPSFPLTSENGNSETIANNGDGTYNYRLNDGTIKLIGSESAAGFGLYVKKVTGPAGETATYHYKTSQGANYEISRIQSVTSNLGYQTKFTYLTDNITSGNAQSEFEYWTATSVTMINNAVDYCDPVADACTGLTQNWPKLTFSNSASSRSVTDSLDQVTVFSWDSINRLTGIKLPSSSSDDFVYTYDANNRVASATKGGVVSNYNWTYVQGAETLTGVRSGSLGTSRTTVANLIYNGVTSSTDALSRITTFSYDSSGRQTGVTFPEGNSVQYTYDARGNVTQATSVAKSGSGLTNIVTYADYDSTCASLVKCNKPNWTKDALGNQTDYNYDSATGQLLNVTQPAAVTGGIRPQVRFSYSPIYAWSKTSNGSFAQAATPVSKLTSVSTCQTTASCAGTTDEQKATIAYQAGSSSTASNLRIASETVAIGNNSVSQTTTIGYDAVGNAISIDGPLAGTADTTALRYDALRRPVGTISADPDGTGSRLPQAVRTTYTAKGLVTLSESGTVTDQSDTAWANFSSAKQVETTFDADDNPTKITVTLGGATHAVTQRSYDDLGRPDCSVQRMDPAQWATQTDACVPQTTGPNGPDRIARPTYDPIGRVLTVTEAVGTAAAAVTQINSYSPNGQLATVKDSENNLTTYEYDGHDRQFMARYPVATKGAAASSTTDYEQLTYNANSLVSQRRLRDGQLINFTYDNLGRVTLKDMPGTEPNVTFGYDLAGRTISAVSSDTLSFNYNALGLLTSTGSYQGTVSYVYDAAGQRKRMIQAGGALTIFYDYDVLGNVLKIRENNATSGVGVLATYAYDNLGRRQSVTFGNGTVQTYGFDSASRLQSLTNNLSGTLNDLTQTFGYNPASQIASVTRSNDAYAWTAHLNADRNYTSNGLNQYSAAGTTGFAYDLRGNLITSGTNTFAYTSENQLKSGPGGALLTYDPLGRLLKSSSATLPITKFQYDGTALIAELTNSGVALRRYVHGPGDDAPIVWYEGTGFTNRRFLMADERGSIVSITDNTGAVIALNRYDEFGIPYCPLVAGQPSCSAPGANQGRFGYTGQTWLPELGMWYYKARVYSPTLGRFMQTDPIGYSDGMNWYNYVGGDPVNKVDPSGTVATFSCEPAAIYRNDEGYQPSNRQSCIMDGAQAWPDFASYFNVGGSYGIASAKVAPPKMLRLRQSGCPKIEVGPVGTATEDDLKWTTPGWQMINLYFVDRNAWAMFYNKYPNSSENDEGDAYRHFIFNFMATKSIGTDATKRWANAHEVSFSNDSPSRSIDLFNNASARSFATDSRFSEMTPDGAFRAAKQRGCITFIR